MSLQAFSSFPDKSRLWIYGADRRLTSSEQATIQDRLDTFIDEWQSHGRPVDGKSIVVEDRFLLIAAVVRGGDISGCGIDSSTHEIDTLAGDLGIEWLPALTIFYRSASGKIKGVSRPDFRQRVREGAITRETGIFDLSIETLGDLRESGFEQPAGSSWHAMVFRIPEAA